MKPPAYAELHCLSNFSFQHGASHADELIGRATELGYAAIAITDECSLAGVVRARDAIKACADLAHSEPGLHRAPPRLIVGAEFRLEDGPAFVLLAPDREAYAQISRLITRGRQTAPKGRYQLRRADCDALSQCFALWLPQVGAHADDGRWLATRTAQAWVAVHRHRGPDDEAQLQALQRLADDAGLRCVAAGGVLFHTRARKTLHDVLTAVRVGKPVYDCGLALLPNAERHLRKPEELATLYPPEMLAETLRIADRCHFDLQQLRYDYPDELVPAGETLGSHLCQLTLAGMQRLWPQGTPLSLCLQLDKELQLIADLRYESFFLTVEDIVRYARSQGILCQGRGSAANSAVCYAIGITAVDPMQGGLLFERFISRERAEPPDIDVDFEHSRREEVMQYVFGKYGRHRTAIAATVISYRVRSALRDVGKALGMDLEDIDRVSRTLAWWDQPGEMQQRLVEQGFDAGAPRMQLWMRLTGELAGFPRHLSQHVGGFVISNRPLDELVPIENASMPDRQVIQWDKDDLESLGLLKVDILALGMLSAISRCLELMRGHDARHDYTLQSIPKEDPQTYDMICDARTVGVFQIESRAQQSMLPRLKPRTFYDLVVQIAIVRPGPITGGMVHPYLRRREGSEARDYPPQLEKVLGRTYGVPIFQEQVMQVAVEAARFTPGEADQMRRSMAAWKRTGGLEKFHDKLVNGMLANGYTAEFAEQIYQRILGFGSYGFPESHSASFAILAYASAWLKRHHLAAFTAALIDSQPMGFYPPSMLVTEARRGGVEVRAVDVMHSHWPCSLEARERGRRPALRLGLRQVDGLSQAMGAAIAAARGRGAFSSVDDLARRAGLGRRELGLLADAGALQSLSGHRHAARWNVAAHTADTGLVLDRAAEPEAGLRAPTLGEDVLDDYRSTGLSLRRHPLALLRPRLARLRVHAASALPRLADRSPVRVAGMVMFRQRPPTAKGVMFMTIEDETGTTNLILRADTIQRDREVVLGTRITIVNGRVQNSGGVLHVMVDRLEDISAWMGELPELSRDFR